MKEYKLRFWVSLVKQRMQNEHLSIDAILEDYSKLTKKDKQEIKKRLEGQNV